MNLIDIMRKGINGKIILKNALEWLKERVHQICYCEHHQSWPNQCFIFEILNMLSGN